MNLEIYDGITWEFKKSVEIILNLDIALSVSANDVKFSKIHFAYGLHLNEFKIKKHLCDLQYLTDGVDIYVISNIGKDKTSFGS